MTKVVVIGNGMVGARFAEELAQRDQAGTFRITVLGAEEHTPYNRVLLSDFVAGKIPAASLELPCETGNGTTVERGASVVALDRERRQVSVHDGRTLDYDVLVLATGARARILPLSGLDPQALPPGVHPLRTLDDAREIVAATMNAKTAIVIGAGVLGLEAATGLARRGLKVTVVHGADALMERQLDRDASAMAVGALAQAGIDCELSASSQGVRLANGRVAGLELADGRTLPCDLLLMACGTIPETALAEAAGLACSRGIAVGPNLATTTDPAIYAIGDCAAPPEGGTGLIAQGWEQARRLARQLVNGPAPASGETWESPTDVIRVKGHGMDIVAMGRSGPRRKGAEGTRAIRLSDPDARRFIEVVVAGDRLVGATCIGAGAVAADLTAAYTRGTPVPTDPAALLLRPSQASVLETGSPTAMPERFTVCRCNGVTKRGIMSAWSAGARTCGDVAAATRATTGCGGCTEVVDGLLDWLRASDPDPSPSQEAAPARAGQLISVKHSSHSLETSAR